MARGVRRALVALLFAPAALALAGAAPLAASERSATVRRAGDEGRQHSGINRGPAAAGVQITAPRDRDKASQPPNREGAQRNVVLIVADDLGLQLGCYGDHAARTPHIDRLAAQGTRFEFAFCTAASCSPSRSVLLTGLYNHANGQYGLQHAYHNFSTRPAVPTLPALLAKSGYRTCSIGKLHVQPEAQYRFERYANEGIQSGRNTLRMAENAEAFLREADARPFFLYFCPTDPHRAGAGFANDQRYPGIEPVTFQPEELPVPHFLPDQPEVRRELAEYYQSVARFDRGVGRLMEALRATGHDDDTLVILLSDNGIPFPGAKTNLYDAGTRLPLIIRAPQAGARGMVSRAMCNWADIAPTILDFAKVDQAPLKLHGRSLLPVLSQAEPQGWDETFGSHTFHEVTMYYPMRSLRTRKYRIILNLAHQLPYPFASDLWESATWQQLLVRGDKFLGSRLVEAYLHRPRIELYDLDEDPREVANRAQDPRYANVLGELSARLRAWQEATGDPWVIKYEHE
jgi:N-sulfoglucosamine sulfohydrolase